MGRYNCWPLLPWLLMALLIRVEASPLADPLGSFPILAKDPFYQTPDDISNTEPGAILRHRRPPSPIAAFRSVPLDLEGSYQILYSTKDNFNESIATVLTVLVPRNASYDKVLSYQVAENGAYGECAPSYAFQQREKGSRLLGTTLSELELFVVQAALKRAWVVVVPDHEGPSSALLANRLAGHAVLDGIRAATRSRNITGIVEDAKVVMWGYSGGSLASGWAAELQPTYAPEVKVAGVALGGTVPRLASAIKSTDRTLFANLIPTGLLGISRQYRVMVDILDRQILPEYRKAFAAAGQECSFNLLLRFAFKNVRNQFRDPTFLTEEPIVSILEENELGKVAPQMPMFIYKPVLDQVSPVRETDGLVSFYCDNGSSVEYVRLRNSDHISALFAGVPGALTWLSGIMDGNVPRRGCVIKNRVLSLFAPDVTEVIPESATAKLLDVFKEVSRSSAS